MRLKTAEDETYKHNKATQAATQASTLRKEYPEVGDCLSEISYFYQDRHHKDDAEQIADKKTGTEKKTENGTEPDLNAIARVWERRDPSNHLRMCGRLINVAKKRPTSSHVHTSFLMNNALMNNASLRRCFKKDSMLIQGTSSTW